MRQRCNQVGIHDPHDFERGDFTFECPGEREVLVEAFIDPETGDRFGPYHRRS